MSRRRDEGLMDSGAVTFCRYSLPDDPGPAGRRTLEELLTVPYQERVVGYAHGYAAKAARQDVDRAIRVWDLRQDGLSLGVTDTLALIDGRYHRILKITPTKDADALPVLDLDLADDDAAIRRKTNA